MRSLEQFRARPANPSPALLLQARNAARPAATQMVHTGASAGKGVQAKSLPTVGDLIARAGPAKSDSLLQRFLNLFRSEKPPDPYKDILTKLEIHHEYAQLADPAYALESLDELASKVTQYQKGHDSDGKRAGMIKDLQNQVTSEIGLLTKLKTELRSTPSPPGVTVSQMLAFTREGVSVKEMTHLLDLGLKLDKPQTAREILDREKVSTAKENMPSGYREILADLGKYQAACTKRFEPDPTLFTPVADLAMAHLKELKTTTESYLKRNNNTESNPHTQAIKHLHAQISIESEVLQGLIDELGDDGVLPEGADLTHALAFARKGVALKDMAF